MATGLHKGKKGRKKGGKRGRCVFEICGVSSCSDSAASVLVHVCSAHRCALSPTLPQIYISNKWGFTKWTKEQYQEMMQDGRLIPDGVHAQYKPDRGPLAEWRKRQAA